MAEDSEDTRKREDALRADYLLVQPLAEKLKKCLTEHLGALLARHKITPAVSMEARVKTIDSLIAKLRRKSLDIGGVAELEDLVGIRLIPLFTPEVEILDGVIKKTFQIVKLEDTSDRLDVSHFGYLSNHYIIKIPQAWKKLPDYAGLGELMAEVQVRTLSQHMWATASHRFQYKREDSVPLPLRRKIHRVSALLEIVDSEFTGILQVRSRYVERSKKRVNEDLPLNVEVLKAVLDDELPAANKANHEPYDSLLAELQDRGIATSDAVRRVIRICLKSVLELDRAVVEGRAGSAFIGSSSDRKAKGVFFTHVGLVRQCLYSQRRSGGAPARAARPADSAIAVSRKAKAQPRKASGRKRTS